MVLQTQDENDGHEKLSFKRGMRATSKHAVRNYDYIKPVLALRHVKIIAITATLEAINASKAGHRSGDRNPSTRSPPSYSLLDVIAQEYHGCKSEAKTFRKGRGRQNTFA